MRTRRMLEFLGKGGHVQTQEKVIGHLQLRKEQNKHGLIPRLVVGHGDLSRTQELVAIIERC